MNAEMPIKAASRHDPAISIFYTQKPVKLFLAFCAGRVVTFYQPKISVPSCSLYGAEALVRWMHPRHGMISPDEFVPMAERTRVIKHLTFWVLKQSFEHCSYWHKQGLDITISVNLSSKDLHDPELPDIVAGIAASTGIEPNWIMLEITESSIMNDPERALIIINRLHQMGYKFSIDDFGTGYSSLAYLKKIPPHRIKNR